MLGNIIVFILCWIGIVTLAFIVCSVAHDINCKIEEIMKRQNKIQCLCKHEFVSIYEFEACRYIDFSTKCRKCGKKRNFRIYKKE